MFEEELFKNALEEVDNPDLLEYAFFNETMGVKIYRKFAQASGLYEYKVFGILDCPAEISYQVYMDLEYRKKWDNYVAELEEKEDGDSKIIYWNVNYPFPLSNRDLSFEICYTYVRECRETVKNNVKTWVILARSFETKSIPPKRKVIRVDDYHQFMVLQETDKNTTRAFMHYYDNPKGMIPTWLINWAAKTGIPSFLKSMKNACENYEEYKKKKDS